MSKITPQEAKELNQNFIRTRSKELNKIVERETGKPNDKDAISTWFSLDEIKEYIAFVEKERPEANGLRIYFGAYSKHPNKPEKKLLSTVFLVPTQAKIGSLQKDGAAATASSSDIEDIDGLNGGGLGDPPNSDYPQ